MGWLKLGSRTEVKAKYQQPLRTFQSDLKATTEHIETATLDSIRKEYPPVDPSLPDDQLSFVPPEEVMRRKSAEDGGLFIDVDKVVYDCTHFIKEHPGGDQIIKSFGGEECSWQFWRFHDSKEMEELGKPLRIGRTEGIVNKFQDPSKYVGLRKLGADEWD